MVEARWLLRTTRQSHRTFRGLSGEDRFFLYAVALQTGIRASELASLKLHSFALDANPPTVTVEAGYTKNGELDVQPLPGELAEPLRPWLARKLPSNLLWPRSWPTRAFRMIAADLADARAAWMDEAGADLRERERRE